MVLSQEDLPFASHHSQLRSPFPHSSSSSCPPVVPPFLPPLSLPPSLNFSFSACDREPKLGEQRGGVRLGLSSEVVQTAKHLLLGETFSRSRHISILPPASLLVAAHPPRGRMPNAPNLGDSGCLGNECCRNGNSLVSLRKGNRPRQKCPSPEQVQPAATKVKAGAGFITETTRQPCYHFLVALMPSSATHLHYWIYCNLFAVWVWWFFSPQLKSEVHSIFFQHLGIDPRTSAEFTYQTVNDGVCTKQRNRTYNIP